MFALRAIMTMTTLVIVLLATLSYGQKFDKRHRIQRNDLKPFYPSPLFGDDCPEGPCMKNLVARAAPSSNAIDFNPNDNSNGFVPFIENDFRKRNSELSGPSQTTESGYPYKRRYVSYSPTVRNLFNDFVPEELKPTPCICITGKRVIDFGTGRYPRYMTGAKCMRTQCERKMECKEIEFEIIIIKTKEDGDLVDVHQPPLPEALLETHVYEQAMIPVGCETIF